jgi:hypothetical protein
MKEWKHWRIIANETHFLLTFRKHVIKQSNSPLAVTVGSLSLPHLHVSFIYEHNSGIFIAFRTFNTVNCENWIVSRAVLCAPLQWSIGDIHLTLSLTSTPTLLTIPSGIMQRIYICHRSERSVNREACWSIISNGLCFTQCFVAELLRDTLLLNTELTVAWKQKLDYRKMNQKLRHC